MSPLAGDRFGAFEIVAPLGAGGMGEVFRAKDTRLGREVAVKLLPRAFAQDEERVARFRREAQLLASLNHPNIAAIHGLEEAGGALALVLELVEGEELSRRLERGPLAVEEATAIAGQLAQGLEAAHERGIVHRDLKPANVKLTPEGAVKILDFGLAKAYQGEGAPGPADVSHSPTLAQTGTQAGTILGTAGYMSPEQARGKPVDKRADIWAFGVVLFEMLTGRRLFDGETTTDVLACVVKEPIRWQALPAATPGGVRRLLERCLERDPKRRLRDIGEARIALEEPPRADDLPRPSPPVPGGLRARAPWAVAAAAVAVAGWALSRANGPASREVVHVDIVYPPDVEPVAGRQGGIAVSPDGKAVVIVGFTGGQRRLFLRRLDRPEAVDLSGTSGAGVFSPDSASVAFVSNATAVTRLQLADGRATVLATGGDFVSGVNLAWGPEHVYFVRGGALWSVPTAGGEARPLTSLDASQGEVLHADALPLPGGRFILFSRLTNAPGTERIEAVPATGGERSVVIEGATTPVWSATGHLLFGRDGAVWAVPFDPATATTLGPALTVIPAGVVGTVRTGSLGFQLSGNGTLAYVPADFDSKRLVSVGRDGSELPLELPAGSYGNPRLSPDGRRFAVERDGSVVDVVDLSRGTRAVVLQPAFGTNFPTWTSDGAKLVFRRFNVPFWAAADGSGSAGPVPHGDANTSPGSAGPDRDSFVAVRLLPETAGDLYLISIGGAFPPKPLVATPAYEGSPQLSPDGRWLLYQSSVSGRPEVYVRRYPELDRAWPVSEGGGVQTRWSPSGREIYYRGGERLMAVAFDGSGAEPRLGRPEALFADVYDFGQGLSIPNYDVTREGRFLMLRRGTQGGTFRVVLNWTVELERALQRGAR